MYVPPHFTESRPEELLAAMRENSFATVVTVAGGAPFVSHVPVLIDGDSVADGLTIRAHFARANPHGEAFAPGDEMLAIFLGPHGYVSPSWYEKPRSVPTWNYVAVHASGPVRLLSRSETRRVVKDLVDLHERTATAPWRLDSLPD